MNCCSPDSNGQLTACATETASAPALRKDFARQCPRCGQTGRSVARQTLLHLLKPELIDRIGERNYRFCSEPDCRVVYFAEGEEIAFTANNLLVCVGLKERGDPIPICYCFGHTVASAREEIARTGRSTVVASITAEIKAGRCACEIRNPSGSCCLGEVSKVVKELLKEHSGAANGRSVAAITPAGSISIPAHDCYAPEKQRGQPAMAQPINHPSETREACCQATARPASRLGRGLMAFGMSGAAIAAICCFAPALLAGLLVAISLGFMLNDAVLMVLLAIFAGIGALGYYLVKRRTAAPMSQQANPNFK
ncbi:MAG: hypothetical protein L0Z53_13855 [Acidobacteriales bacterium]|nr:hypothetical protein [Terriglobales bacterium]